MGAKHGFTLLEVLIAVLVLGIGIIAVMQLFPPSLYQARLATERVPLASWADREMGILRSWGLSQRADGPRMAWPVDLHKPVETAWGESFMQYTIEPLCVRGMRHSTRSSLSRAAEMYYLYRVTIALPRPDGRYETFTTMVSRY